MPIYKGPYEIFSKAGKHSFILTDKNGKVRRKFHTASIKPYNEREKDVDKDADQDDEERDFENAKGGQRNDKESGKESEKKSEENAIGREQKERGRKKAGSSGLW